MAPLLEQLKNFIRHGKSGKDMKPRDSGASVHSTSSTKSKSRMGSRNTSPSRITSSATSTTTGHTSPQQNTNTNKNDSNIVHTNKEAASRIVDEEKLAKNKMPVYPGLERYRLVEKMGE